MKNKRRLVYSIASGLAVTLLLLLYFLSAKKDSRAGRTAYPEETAVRCKVVYNMEVTSQEMAEAAIREEGERQRESYSNPKIKKLELWMEKEFGILAVNLGEMSEETAREICEGFSYMYEEYPQLYQSLTNLSIGNMGRRTGGTLALTERMPFIVNGDYGICPYVEKYQIVLNARAFLNEERLKKTCEDLSEAGFWPKGANISSIIVHELGHQLQNVLALRRYGMTVPYYITEDKTAAYALYNTDRLSRENNMTEELLKEAYESWKAVYGNHGTYEAFAASISGYALKDEKETNYSYSETFAEAVTDVYLNKESASEASLAIVSVIKETLAK